MGANELLLLLRLKGQRDVGKRSTRTRENDQIGSSRLFFSVPSAVWLFLCLDCFLLFFSSFEVVLYKIAVFFFFFMLPARVTMLVIWTIGSSPVSKATTTASRVVADRISLSLSLSTSVVVCVREGHCKKRAAARARVSPLFSKYLKIVSFFLRGERRRRRVWKQKINQEAKGWKASRCVYRPISCTDNLLSDWCFTAG